MKFNATSLPYQQTGYLSKIIADYLEQSEKLGPFYAHPPNLEGIKASIQARRNFPTNRQLLVETLREQYAALGAGPNVNDQLGRLLENNCFTITTAHQPVVFTGPLYFIYKILHAIKLADHLNHQIPECRFVPVFYMGSEDADLEELGSIYLDHEKLEWETRQTGAVGRMKTKGIEKMIDRITGEYLVQPFGKELLELFRKCYQASQNIQLATFKLVDALFAEYGLVILIPDHPALKRAMVPVFEDDLLHNKPWEIVSATAKDLSVHYKVQAQPREVNLFYLKDDLRGRIEGNGEGFIIHESSIRMQKDEMIRSLHEHPECFSPNVILRGLMQETILPGVAFIGGGGETAYWLEYKRLFEYYGVPFPALVLRNSFLIIESRWKEKMLHAGLTPQNIFYPSDQLFSEMVILQSQRQLDLSKEINEASHYYQRLKDISMAVDPTLSSHVEALQAKALKPLKELEKKMLRAEKRKFEESQKTLEAIKSELFPFGQLQERIENFIPYYAQWGRQFIQEIYQHSPGFEHLFLILEETS